MASYFYALERDPSKDESNHCWHCKSDAAFTGYRIVAASTWGRVFLSLSTAQPLLVCGKCGKASQKLTTGGKLMVGLSWLPITLMFGAGAAWVSIKAVEDPALRDTALVLVGLTAAVAFVAGFMLWRVLRMPIYPTAGRPVEQDGKTYLGR